MLTQRQDEKRTRKKTEATRSQAEILAALAPVAQQIHETLNLRGSEKYNQPTQAPEPHYPPASITESQLHHSEKSSEEFKKSMEIKKSSHDIDIVQLNDGGCDLVWSTPFPNKTSLNTLPGSAHACYILTADKKLYYADKRAHILTPVTISAAQFDTLLQTLAVKSVENPEPDSFTLLQASLSDEQLQQITEQTRHLHGMGFYKRKSLDNVMSQLEAANSTAYQLLGPRHFPTCIAVRDEDNHYTGVVSRLLPGFKPNRDNPLQTKDLELCSLKNMIKNRSKEDEHKILEIFDTIKEILPLLKREPNSNQGIFSRVWTRTLNAGNYYLGDQHNAQHIYPSLEQFTKQNAPTITFGELESIRRLLIGRKKNIEQVKASYVASKHKHEDELPLLNKCIQQLNLLLLDEIALFIEQLHQIDKDLRSNWVDIEAEKNNPNSAYKDLKISKGLLAPLAVSLDDIQNFRIQTGQAIGLTARYFMQDPDGHAKNLSRDGSNVDGDLAVYPLTYRFKVPSRKPGPNDYMFDVNDYINFPILTAANFRYWPTKATIFDTSTDTALSQVSEVTKNYFTLQDNNNFQELEKSPVFSFQKYLQLIILSLMDKDMFAACAQLHMDDNLRMLNDDGDAASPLALYDVSGHPQDLRTRWIESLANRASDARMQLAMQLNPIKMILERHDELTLSLIQDHFKLFIDHQRTELAPEAMKILDAAIHPEKIKLLFEELKKQVCTPKLAAEDANQQTTTLTMM